MFELEKYPGSSELYDFDFTGLLAPSETLLTVDSVTVLPALSGADALTFGSKTINTVAITYPDGVTAAIGKVVQIRVMGGTAEAGQPKRNYAVTITCTTSSGSTSVVKADMAVLTLAPLNNLI
jgi:hypothetical protein